MCLLKQITGALVDEERVHTITNARGQKNSHGRFDQPEIHTLCKAMETYEVTSIIFSFFCTA